MNFIRKAFGKCTLSQIYKNENNCKGKQFLTNIILNYSVAVFFLNISNNALWISYSSVADLTARYYDKEISDVDLLSSIGFFVGIPFCLASTWIVDKRGLK
jgi:hypothetical protein